MPRRSFIGGPFSMKLLIYLVAAMSAISLTSSTRAQDKSSPLDRYLETGKTILIAKCLRVGPVNILLRADVEVEILLVVKGKETLGKITINSQFGMEEGERYLLRTENEASVDKPYFRIESIESVIPLVSSEDIETLKTLSPRIVVLRTMNIRVDRLDSDIRRLTYELDALKAAQKEN